MSPIAPAIVALTLLATAEEVAHQEELRAIRLINELRASGYDCATGKRTAAAVPPLMPHPKLMRAARIHSRDMLSGHYFGHEGADESTPRERVAAVGFRAARASENIAGGQRVGSSPERALAWWKASRVHCNNLMNKEFRNVGVGAVHDPKDPEGIVNYWTVVFATPDH